MRKRALVLFLCAGMAFNCFLPVTAAKLQDGVNEELFNGDAALEYTGEEAFTPEGPGAESYDPEGLTADVQDVPALTVGDQADEALTGGDAAEDLGEDAQTIEELLAEYQDTEGLKEVSYKIVPKGTTIKELIPSTAGIKVTVKAQKTQTSGYEIQYSLSGKFKEPAVVRIKNTGTDAFIPPIDGKTYYVRVRTYKTVSGKRYYSGWSSAKSAKAMKGPFNPPNFIEGNISYDDFASKIIVNNRRFDSYTIEELKALLDNSGLQIKDNIASGEAMKGDKVSLTYYKVGSAGQINYTGLYRVQENGTPLVSINFRDGFISVSKRPGNKGANGITGKDRFTYYFQYYPIDPDIREDTIIEVKHFLTSEYESTMDAVKKGLYKKLYTTDTYKEYNMKNCFIPYSDQREMAQMESFGFHFRDDSRNDIASVSLIRAIDFDTKECSYVEIDFTLPIK